MKRSFLEQLGKLQLEERKSVLGFLREVWDYYDENYSFAAFGREDERIEFLQEVFLNPLGEAMDEVAVEIGCETSKQRVLRQLQEISKEKGNADETVGAKEGEDPLPF